LLITYSLPAFIPLCLPGVVLFNILRKRFALPSLHTLHAKFRADRSGNGNLFFTDFLFDPPACRVKAGVWQIGIEFEPHRSGSLPAGVPKETYITVVEKEGNYFLKEVSKSSVPRYRF
jgi:hypothetical protein